MDAPDLKEQPAKKKPSSLGDLENRLYSRTPPPLRHDEEFMGEEKHIRIAPEWTSEAERKESAFYSIIATAMPWLKRLFIASLLFFMFAGGLLFFGIWRGSNTVSPQNINIAVSVPLGTPAGEETSVEITVGNGNAVDLESVDLLVEFPDGTSKPDNLAEPLLRYRDGLGVLSSSKSTSRRIAFVPFGEEGEEKKLVVTVEYRPKDSNAIFSRKVEHTFSINSAPVIFRAILPKEVNSDQVFDITLKLISNSAVTQENLLVKAEYPFGFQFIGSDPKPLFGQDTWALGDVEPKGERSIKLQGRLQATENEERTFHFSVGTQNAKNERELGAVFLTEVPSIIIQRPFIYLDLLLNGKQGETFVGRSGQALRVDIPWENTLTGAVSNLEITAKLSGDVYNKALVSPTGGFYDASTNTLIWNKEKIPAFFSVKPGEKGNVSFNVGVLPIATSPTTFKNPELIIEVTARGKRLTEDRISEDITSFVKKEIKIATVLTLSSRLFYTDGPLLNQGPIPPKAEVETTYTVTWSLSNASNKVGGAEVSTVLPSYVRWVGEVSPPSANISYNQIGGRVVWKVGDVEPGSGVGTTPREASFKVALLSGVGDIGTAPVVIGESSARGTDLFAGTEVVSNMRPALTTESLSDSGAKERSGVVVK